MRKCASCNLSMSPKSPECPECPLCFLTACYAFRAMFSSWRVEDSDHEGHVPAKPAAVRGQRHARHQFEQRIDDDSEPDMPVKNAKTSVDKSKINLCGAFMQRVDDCDSDTDVEMRPLVDRDDSDADAPAADLIESILESGDESESEYEYVFTKPSKEMKIGSTQLSTPATMMRKEGLKEKVKFTKHAANGMSRGRAEKVLREGARFAICKFNTDISTLAS